MLFGKNKSADLAQTPDLQEAIGSNRNSKDSTPGVILGWRYWSLDDNTLSSPYKNYPWGDYLMDTDSLKDEQGFYAYATSTSLCPKSPEYPVMGLIAASGDICLHDTGFRAKNMQILALTPGKIRDKTPPANGYHHLHYHNGFNNYEPGLDPDFNLAEELCLEGKESVVFFDDIFSLIRFGFCLAEKEGFMFQEVDRDNQRDVIPELISEEIQGEDFFRTYSYANSQYSYKNKVLHSRNDEPAKIENGCKTWYRDGLIHRDDGPAFVGITSDHPKAMEMPPQTGEVWYQNGLIHRAGDLPASIDSHGSKEWYQNGRLYREGGLPHKELADGTKIYVSSYSNDHNPSELKIDPQGTKYWYQNGKLVKTQYPGETVDQEVIESLRDQLVVVSDRVGELTEQLGSLQETNIALVEFIEKNLSGPQKL